MNTSKNLIHKLLAPCLITTLAVMVCSPLAAQRVDPDPDLFDGTRTKKDQIPQDEKQKTDKWMEANLILYDSDEQGSQEGGQGRVGGEGPGFADGMQGGGMQGGIPMPMMGGGGSSDKPGAPGMVPMSQQSTPTAGGPSSEGTPPPGGKPGDVAIGDPNQKIASAAQPVSKVQGGAPPPVPGSDVQESKGEDTTTIPSSAAGPQGSKRGGGVEKGDAMPTDI